MEDFSASDQRLSMEYDCIGCGNDLERLAGETFGLGELPSPGEDLGGTDRDRTCGSKSSVWAIPSATSRSSVASSSRP